MEIGMSRAGLDVSRILDFLSVLQQDKILRDIILMLKWRQGSAFVWPHWKWLIFNLQTYLSFQEYGFYADGSQPALG